MKKLKRSQVKRITLTSRILRYMRMSRGISMRETGRLVGCSDGAIAHYEQGRVDVTPERVRVLVELYGFAWSEFEEFAGGRPLPVLSLKDECIGLLDRIDDEKLRAVHAVLRGFVS